MEGIRTLEELPLEGSRVLVRADLDISDALSQADAYRVHAVIPTLRYLQAQRAQVTIAAHLGRPTAREEALSLRPFAPRLETLLGAKVAFFDPWSPGNAKGINDGAPFALLENLRFHPGEHANDIAFARELAAGHQFYVNEAFADCHRAHASVAQLPLLLPGAAGMRLRLELETLSRIVQEPARPLVVITGGVKVETKLRIIERFLRVADAVLVGGGLANMLLAAQGVAIGNVAQGMDRELARRLTHHPKLRLPVDVITAQDAKNAAVVYTVSELPAGAQIYDIGPRTIELFSRSLATAATIVWNGAMGLMTQPEFREGTKQLAAKVAASRARTIIGGGSMSAALHDFGLADRIEHISTGGGAMLAYLAGDELPGITALKESTRLFHL